MDDELIARACAGEQDAFGQLIEKYDELAQRTARAFLQERETAEDAVQEAWVDAWRGLAGFRQGRPFRPWLLSIVANRCRMKVRRRRFRFVPFAWALSVAASAEMEGDPAFLVGRTDPELEQALGALSAGERQVLSLRFYTDLSLDEIAHVLDLPVGTVKSRLHRALKWLRRWLGPEAIGQRTTTERVET